MTKTYEFSTPVALRPRRPALFVSKLWKWFKIVNNADFLGVLFNPSIEYTATRIYVAYNADIAEVQAIAYSEDGGVTWSAPVLSADPAFAVNRGGLVLRGSKVDLYANRLSSVPSNFLLNIKRFTFDGVSWESVVTVLSKTTTTHFAIRRPYPFRNPDDNTKRSLVWLENQRRDQLASGPPLSGSATRSFPWTSGGFYGLCCPSCTSYDKWSVVGDPFSNTFDIAGFSSSLLSYVIIRGVEANVTRTDTGLGANTGYLRPDLTNPGRFRQTCDVTCQNTPAGACTAAKTVTTSGSAGMQLRKANNSLGSSKSIPVGTSVQGGVTDKWGFASISPADLATFKFFVSESFASDDDQQATDTITLTGASPPALPDGTIQITVNSVRIYFESYGELFYADLDASGNLTGITSLKDGLRVSDQYNGYFNAAGEQIVSWREPSDPPVDTLIHRRVKVGGAWQAEETHAYSATDFGDQIAETHVGAPAMFVASLKESNQADFNALRRDGAAFGITYRRVVGGVATDVVYTDLRDAAVSNPAPGAEAVNNDGLNLAALQADNKIKVFWATDDGVNFDLWYVTKDE